MSVRPDVDTYWLDNVEGISARGSADDPRSALSWSTRWDVFEAPVSTVWLQVRSPA